MLATVRERPALFVSVLDAPIATVVEPGLETCILYVVAVVVAGLSINMMFPTACLSPLMAVMSLVA